ncbi:hypothetical protein C8Q80DRAFT_1268016 [Daedaleopsis nitida]|nr:hypothetical protein C8Q80DRAFT_1268016 [Daedaleopsis nitida]
MLPATQNAPASFQLALPHLLASISPSLAALHATRVRRLSPAIAHPSLAGTHCVNCGYPLIASDSQTRSVRKRRKRRNGHTTVSRVLRRSCRSCGHDEDVPLATGADAPTFPMPRNRAKRESGNSMNPPRASSAATPTPAQIAPSIPHSPAPRSCQPIASSSTPVPSRPGSAASVRPPADQLPPSRVSSTGSTKVYTAQQDLQRSKARTKKHTGLQSMLARNRERQEQEKKREEGHSHGLSAFLQGL